MPSASRNAMAGESGKSKSLHRSRREGNTASGEAEGSLMRTMGVRQASAAALAFVDAVSRISAAANTQFEGAAALLMIGRAESPLSVGGRETLRRRRGTSC